MNLSIIIPVFNEKETILTILERIDKVKIPGIKKELIIVDDFSTDGTRKILKTLKNHYKICFHKRNFGKGAAIRTALRHVRGDIILIQDADLEYSPEDYPKLLKPIIEGKANIVYGSRGLMKKNKWFSFLYFLGGWSMNQLANLLYNSNLTDLNCGYKVFKKEVFDGIIIEGNRFEFCEEITAKVLKKNYQIIEVPVRYNARSFKEGKKLNWKDGFTAIKTLIRYRFFKKIR